MAGFKQSRTLPLQNVTVADPFWSKYQQLVRDVVIPYQWEALNDRVPDAAPSHAMRNFRIAAGLEKGEFYGFVFQDTDVAKWLETVSYCLMLKPDPALAELVDEVIAVIAQAQQPDGYLNTYYIIKEPGKRWTNLREAHELYTAGHFIEAAVAHYQATGKRTLLEIMQRFADHIDETFGPEPGKLRGYPGHPEIELALVKLYAATGEKRYLRLSQFFIEERGQEPDYFEIEAEKRGHTAIFSEFKRFDRKYAQTHLPVRQQTVAVGHAVRAVYLYSGMADVAAETGDRELFEVCQRLWQNIVTKQLYITGGIGASSFGEAFTFDYDLPNDTVYAETCASIGLMMFAQRMLKLETDRRYADVLEQALYNTVLSGISLDGTRYFYVNPLAVWPEASAKDHHKQHVKPVRQKWYACACCPPNLSRTILALGSYAYMVKDRTLAVHLYVGGQATVELDGQPIRLTQTTNYPWEGKVTLALTLAQAQQFGLSLRIPGWCREARLAVNGVAVALNAAVLHQGYAQLNRTWQNGDQIELEFAMPVEVIQAHPQVRANAGKVALMRGPLVFCLEEMDNGRNLAAIVLPKEPKFTATFEEGLLGGTVVIHGEAFRLDESAWHDRLYQPVATKLTPVTLKAVPYHLWGNRTPGEMLVWMLTALS
jgi:uncharacterized protein